MNKENLSEKEIKSIEEIALVNLQEEIKGIVKDKTKEETVDFIFDKLDSACLGRLVQD